ncbi:hypothetical protein AV530_017199 [Patagioenas fasciata monilis]|uniref:Uncharacterized protein n=1 Tax=Patagioenas fasciata monilis TaxID=372326 RepID=A0A1V4JFJ6_PATFA|nr:hypothetical protein AV530_017199 [Patagioenas fasciata monilis]
MEMRVGGSETRGYTGVVFLIEDKMGRRVRVATRMEANWEIPALRVFDANTCSWLVMIQKRIKTAKPISAFTLRRECALSRVSSVSSFSHNHFSVLRCWKPSDVTSHISFLICREVLVFLQVSSASKVHRHENNRSCDDALFKISNLTVEGSGGFGQA